MQEMTIGEIESSFDSEWVLVGDPATDEAFNVLRGEVLHHSKDRDEVYRRGLELRPKRMAILYLGRPPEGTVIVLRVDFRAVGGLPAMTRVPGSSPMPVLP